MNREENSSDIRDSVSKHPLFKVTKLSKYVAMALFIIMPFVGIWIGYTYAPIKVVEIEISGNQEVSETETLRIERAEIVNDGDVEVSFSTGEKKIVALAKKPEDVKQYFDIETFQKTFISPNREFVALQATEFEEAFVQVYNVESDRLESKIYGVVTGWDNVGRLGILSCNLAGEECTSYISNSPETPWIMVEVAL